MSTSVYVVSTSASMSSTRSLYSASLAMAESSPSADMARRRANTPTLTSELEPLLGGAVLGALLKQARLVGVTLLRGNREAPGEDAVLGAEDPLASFQAHGLRRLAAKTLLHRLVRVALGDKGILLVGRWLSRHDGSLCAAIGLDPAEEAFGGIFQLGKGSCLITIIHVHRRVFVGAGTPYVVMEAGRLGAPKPKPSYALQCPVGIQ